MKRCPECGYRAKADDLRECPLCGVRMRSDPGGQTVRIETHVHSAEGERCFLPNTKNEAAAKARQRNLTEKTRRSVRTYTTNTTKVDMPKQLKQVIGIAVVLILYTLIASCSA